MPPIVAIAAAAALVGVTAAEARDLARDYRGFYGHVNAASLRGLGFVNQRAGRNDAVVTDQCWGFSRLGSSSDPSSPRSIPP